MRNPTYNELQRWLLVERKYSDNLRLERDAARGEALAASVVGEKLAQQVDNMAAEARETSQRRSEGIARIEVLSRRLRHFETQIKTLRAHHDDTVSKAADLEQVLEMCRKHRIDAESKLYEIRQVLVEVGDLPRSAIFKAYSRLRNAIA